VAGHRAEQRHFAGDDVTAEEAGVQTDPVLAVGKANRRLAEARFQLCRSRGTILGLAGVVAVAKEARPGWLAVAGHTLELPLAAIGRGPEQRQDVPRMRLDAPVAQVGEQLRGVRDFVRYNAANSEAAASGEYERRSPTDIPQPRSGRREQHLATP
jgi:hypothetical protein